MENTKASKAEKAPKAQKEPKPAKEVIDKITKNDVTRPKEGSKTGRVWALADKISAEKQAPADRGTVIDQATAQGINEATASTQFGRWTKFHGIVALRKEKAVAPAAAAPAEAATA